MENNSSNSMSFGYDINWLRAELIKMEYELTHSKSQSDLIIQKKMRLERFKRLCKNLQSFPNIEQFYELSIKINELKRMDNELHSIMVKVIYNPVPNKIGYAEISMPLSSSNQNLSDAKY